MLRKGREVMEQTHHLVKELLPLYIDEALGPEVKTIVEQHLQKCVVCKTELRQLKNDNLKLDLIQVDWPHEERNVEIAFIKRLKKLGLLAGCCLIVVMIVLVFGSWESGRLQTEREFERKEIEQQQEINEVDRYLQSVSPNSKELMEQSDVQLRFTTTAFSTKGTQIAYEYLWNNPEIDYVQEDTYWTNRLIVTDLTNKEVIHINHNESAYGAGKASENWVLDGIRPSTKMLSLELPNLFIFFKTPAYRTDLPLTGTTWINQNMTIHNVEFYIEKAVVEKTRVVVYYKQLTPIEQVGLYELTFNLFDAAKKHWSTEPLTDFQTEGERTAVLLLSSEIREPLELRLSHAVLVATGLRYMFVTD